MRLVIRRRGRSGVVRNTRGTRTRDEHLERAAPVFVASWCVVAYGLARILFIPARRIFNARRENLVLLA